MRLTAALILLAAVLATTSAVAAPGIAIRWNTCYGDGGAANQDFACDMSVGANSLTVSFSPPMDMDQINGNEVIIDLLSASATLPPWWQFKNPGACRQLSLGTNFSLPADATNCLDTWQEQAAGGIGAYNLNYYGGSPNRPRISLVVAVPANALASVLVGHEYFSLNLTINHMRTVGTGACSGCLTPMCILATQLKITRSVGLGDVTLTDPLGPNSNTAAWQGGSPALYFNPPDRTGLGSWYITSCGLPTPARNPTWGAIKSLYR